MTSRKYWARVNSLDRPLGGPYENGGTVRGRENERTGATKGERRETALTCARKSGVDAFCWKPKRGTKRDEKQCSKRGPLENSLKKKKRQTHAIGLQKVNERITSSTRKKKKGKEGHRYMGLGRKNKERRKEDRPMRE